MNLIPQLADEALECFYGNEKLIDVIVRFSNLLPELKKHCKNEEDLNLHPIVRAYVLKINSLTRDNYSCDALQEDEEIELVERLLTNNLRM